MKNKRQGIRTIRQAEKLPVIQVTNQKELNSAMHTVKVEGRPRIVQMLRAVQ